MKTFFLYINLFLISFITLFAKDKQNTICLNMIVKNEKDVIKRSLSSVKNFIDYWVIVDTGSTDGTQKIIKEFMKDIPGELYEREWVDFAFNRNQALSLAKNKADYVLFLDADDQLVFEKDFKKPKLDLDFYLIKIKHGSLEHFRTHLVKNSLNWKWEGVIHEAITSSQSQTYGNILNVFNLISTDGARSKDPHKFEKDALVLEKAISKDPDNRRYMFYLAQSYRDAGKYKLAIKNYEKRVAMGGWDQEIFWSLYQIAKMQQILQLDPSVFISSFFKAFVYRDSRVEPLYYVINYYRMHNNYSLGYYFAKLAVSIPYPKDILFVEDWIYKYGILLELSICAYWIEKYEESKAISEKILKISDLPQNVRTVVENNLKFAIQKIGQNRT
jgi:glycosyltransferase involved in cell wall biosynthesis